jgi:metallo-beta-lactamase class B
MVRNPVVRCELRHSRPGCQKLPTVLSLAIAAAIVLPYISARTALAAPAGCPKCDEWTRSQTPFKVYGNTYYVGTRALSSILITSDAGHVLIDGTVDESASQVAANIGKLGFKVEDVRLILNSHVHFDHAGGIAELQRLSGARVAASAASAHVLMTGHSGSDDPLFGEVRPLAPVHSVQVIKEGQTLDVGSVRMTAHLTPGHTPGGTSWTWRSCEADRCLNMVYADSLSPIAGKHFKFSDNSSYPNVLQDFSTSFARLDTLPCDILLTPHPELSRVLQRLQRSQTRTDSNALADPTACHRYVEAARSSLARRIAQEEHAQNHGATGLPGS